MATGDIVPNDRIIYRAIRFQKKVEKDGRPKFQNYILKPATEEQEDETYLSFGTAAETARAGLKDVYGYSPVTVGAIVALRDENGQPRNLEVREDDDPGKVRVSGIPLKTIDENLALAIAKDLARISGPVVAY